MQEEIINLSYPLFRMNLDQPANLLIVNLIIVQV